MRRSRSLINRMIRAARLDIELYEEVEADTTATWQAFESVLIASLAGGLGSAILDLIREDDPMFAGILAVSVASSIIGWILWSLITYFIGTKLLPGPQTSATPGELLRTLGFAMTPMVLSLFIFVPYLGAFIALGAFVWFVMAGVIAVRQALDFSTTRAIGTCLLALIPYFVLMGLIQWVLF